MNARLKNTLGLVLGLIGCATVNQAQIDVEWTTTLYFDKNTVNRELNDVFYWNFYESRFSGSIIAKFSAYAASEPLAEYSKVTQINTQGQIVGSYDEIVPYGIIRDNGDILRPVMAGVDWMLCRQVRNGIPQQEYRVADGHGGYVSKPFQHEVDFGGDQTSYIDLIEIGSMDGDRVSGLYQIVRGLTSVTIRKFKPTLRVTDPQPNSTPQSSISRTESGVTLSTDTQAGQSYRVQSSQDLKQWSDEEVIQGDGSTKSVQRPADKPREFLRVVEE